MTEIVEVPSPLALVAHRARMAVDEAKTGRLRTMSRAWLSRNESVTQEQLRFLSPLSWEYSRRTWGGAMTWRVTDAGPVAMMELDGITLVSKPPTHLHVEDGQLHSIAGPAVVWEDGTAHCFLRGVLIPPRLWGLLMRGELEIDEVMRTRNQAVQAVLMEQIGWADAMRNPRYTCVKVDHDERWGTLWDIEWWSGEPDPQRPWLRNQATVLEVVNRSREPDGHFRHYWLQVNRDLRPIQADGTLGVSQPRTSLNAVASTFGMLGEEYARMLGAES